MELAERILAHLDQHSSADSLRLAHEWQEDHQKIVGAIKSLESLGNVVRAEIVSSTRWELTGEGLEVAKRGSHEAVVFHAVPEKGVSQTDLMKAVGATSGKVGLGKAMSAGWLQIDKQANLVKRKVPSITDTVQVHLKAVADNRAETIAEKERAEYKKRKLLQEAVVKSYVLSKGDDFSLKIEKGETELTPEMIASGSWQSTKFKPYNFDALGIQPPAGHLHPLLKVRAEYRQIFLEMGFTEMPTNHYVESSFWNFDALFQPQQHPARDAHDTFFISEPANATEFPMDYLERVRKVHSEGGYGSQGYGYDWKIEEAKKNLLRTHTTSTSARMLYKLAQQKEFKPQKYFSIDRVFRNETLDATHLAEFHQIEGVIAVEGLTLGDLIGMLYEFYRKLGIEKLRFKPAYNPYTEPSMEVFSYHEGLKKWVEIGNSGLFRPEMLLPFGLPEGVNVAGYGLSLERPTMIKYGIDNIRELCGNKVNLKMVQENPICRLDKDTRNPLATLISITDRRWENILSRLDTLSSRLASVRSSLDLPMSNAPKVKIHSGYTSPLNVVVCANPKRPLYSVKAFVTALGEEMSVTAKTHVHSSVKQISSGLLDFISCNEGASRSAVDIIITLIWKDIDESYPTLTTSCKEIRGEIDIARYFSRIIKHSIPYDELPAQESAFIDSQLDIMHHLASNKTGRNENLQTLSQSLTRLTWLSGKNLSISDILLWSYLMQEKCQPQQAALKEWLKRCRISKLMQ